MKQLTAMLERTADGAMDVDQEGKIMLWNRAVEHVLGFRATDVLGRFCHDVLCGDTLSITGDRSACCPIRAIARKPTENAQAYDACLRGRNYTRRETRLDLEYALQMFEHAIQLDPNFALAFAGLANTCGLIYERSEERR